MTQTNAREPYKQLSYPVDVMAETYLRGVKTTGVISSNTVKAWAKVAGAMFSLTMGAFAPTASDAAMGNFMELAKSFKDKVESFSTSYTSIDPMDETDVAPELQKELNVTEGSSKNLLSKLKTQVTESITSCIAKPLKLFKQDTLAEKVEKYTPVFINNLPLIISGVQTAASFMLASNVDLLLHGTQFTMLAGASYYDSRWLRIGASVVGLGGQFALNYWNNALSQSSEFYKTIMAESNPEDVKKLTSELLEAPANFLDSFIADNLDSDRWQSIKSLPIINTSISGLKDLNKLLSKHFTSISKVFYLEYLSKDGPYVIDKLKAWKKNWQEGQEDKNDIVDGEI